MSHAVIVAITSKRGHQNGSLKMVDLVLEEGYDDAHTRDGVITVQSIIYVRRAKQRNG